MPRRLLRLLPLLPTLLVALAYAADRTGVTPVCARQPQGSQQVRIVRAVDADTLEDACGRRLRLVSVDAPERDTADGVAASAWVREWLRHAPEVTLHFCAAEPMDRYERYLVDVERADGADLAQALLAAGHAAALIIPPCGLDEAPAALATMAAAQAAGAGQWASLSTTPTAAANVTPERRYVVVEDVVAEVRERADGIALMLGAPPALEALIPTRDRARMLAAYPDLLAWAGRSVRVEGKPSWRGTRPRLWLSVPGLLRPGPAPRSPDSSPSP